MFPSGEACVTSAKVGALLGIIWKSYNFFPMCLVEFDFS